VGLTEETIKDLQDKKFDQLFEKYLKEWNEMADNAFSLARAYISKGKTASWWCAKDAPSHARTARNAEEASEKEHAKYARYRIVFGRVHHWSVTVHQKGRRAMSNEQKMEVAKQSGQSNIRDSRADLRPFTAAGGICQVWLKT
jgi:hypothetical protein